MPTLPPTKKPIQMTLFNIATQKEVDGVEMGVLDNGITYLTESGLARMCGIDRKSLNQIATMWDKGSESPRLLSIVEKLQAAEYREPSLYLKSFDEARGQEVNAYPGPVCLALLEYYAFDAEDKKEQALKAFRTLARVSFDEFIYQAVGYNPKGMVSAAWQQFHDRVDLTQDAAPEGFWSVFRETAPLIVTLINKGVPVGSSVMPDGSVGIAWSSYWTSINGDNRYRPRCQYPHMYPSYFPQAKSNPQMAYAYPEEALGEFRKWFREIYLPTKYPAYIKNLGRKLTIDTAEKAIEAITGERPNFKRRIS
jgi:hypothetical protein